MKTRNDLGKQLFKGHFFKSPDQARKKPRKSDAAISKFPFIHYVYLMDKKLALDYINQYTFLTNHSF